MSERDELAAIWQGDRALTLARVDVLDRAAAAWGISPNAGRPAIHSRAVFAEE